MELEDLVRPEGVIAHLKVTSKKQALQELSERAAKLTGLSERAIFETLLEREALARISRLLRNQAVVEKLRASEDGAALFAILTEPAATNAA